MLRRLSAECPLAIRQIGVYHLHAQKRRYARMACASALRGDISFASCASWCKPSETHHCDWCKCRACDFCHNGLDSFALPPSVVVPPSANCGPATSVGPLRLSACGADLFSSDGERRPVLLSGVNMYLEWLVKYRDKVHRATWQPLVAAAGGF